uniref:Uncharacterized protein n=1 Tax=Setaria viridis TaxID=4556 RepID=A0A4U6VM23_SETVI|nr:hypothetical protein SEVIR_2G060150v2 [Setaria viridis]
MPSLPFLEFAFALVYLPIWECQNWHSTINATL